MIKKYGLKPGFSLIEVLISFLILSIVMVALAPVVTKKISFGKNDGVVFTYRADNHTNTNNVCFATTLETYTGLSEVYTATSECSEYTFTIPEGVNLVNLTLVAGGGGGGGAAGGTDEGDTVNSSVTFSPDLLGMLRINYLTDEGSAGGVIGNGNSSGSDCYSNYKYCGGRGGAASPAIVNLTLSDNLMHGGAFVNELDVDSIPAGGVKISAGSGTNASVAVYDTEDNVEKGVVFNSSDGTYTIYETTTSTDDEGNTTSTTEKFNSYSVSKENYISAIDGEYGLYAGDSETVADESVYLGGTGGKNPYTGGYGNGGNGAALKFKCETTGGSCEAQSAKNRTQLFEPGSGTNGGASVTYSAERPGGTGGGGAAGAVVRITGFPVTPGDTYVIRVGKGGTGGKSGASELAGSNGGGGVSTAIYNSSGKLVFMVNGGAPGEGGSAYSGSNGYYTGVTGTSGRNYPKVFYGENYQTSVKTDTTLMTTSALLGNAPNISYYGGGYTLLYSAFNNEPYLTMNLNTLNATDSRSGGFSNFSRDKAVSTPAYSTTGLQYEKIMVYSDNNYEEFYDGLYYRTLINNSGAYVGGLGGFNGLGGKSGCGGYFLGNFDGRGRIITKDATTGDETSEETDDSTYLNKFIFDQDEVYDVFQYYDNCTIKNSNGQTANFVLPKPASLKFGQAGAGGGGGGWNVVNGAGNGGDGQNGYLMIDWRK